MADGGYPVVMIDEWMDGYIDERAWVEVTTRTSTETQAIDALEGEIPIADRDDGQVYVVEGTSWYKPVGFAVPGHEELRSELPLEEYDACRVCGGNNKDCEDCYGTGRDADWIHNDDGVPYEECAEGDDGSLCFWNVTLAPAPESSGEHGRVSGS